MGTAQLAATAATRSTPESGPNTVSSPLVVSTAVMRRSRSGQSWTGSRERITPSRSTLPGAWDAWATRPTRASLSRPLPGST